MVGKTVTSLPCSATPWYRIIRACSLLTKHAFHQYEKARLVAKLKVARERKKARVGPQVMGRDQSAVGTRSKATGDHPRDISGCAKSLPNSPSLVTSTSGAFSFQLRPYSQCLQLKLSVGRQRPSYMRTFAACVWSRSRSRKGCASPRLSFNCIETHCGFCALMGPSVPSTRSPTGR